MFYSRLFTYRNGFGVPELREQSHFC